MPDLSNFNKDLQKVLKNVSGNTSVKIVETGEGKLRPLNLSFPLFPLITFVLFFFGLNVACTNVTGSDEISAELSFQKIKWKKAQFSQNGTQTRIYSKKSFSYDSSADCVHPIAYNNYTFPAFFTHLSIQRLNWTTRTTVLLIQHVTACGSRNRV